MHETPSRRLWRRVALVAAVVMTASVVTTAPFAAAVGARPDSARLVAAAPRAVPPVTTATPSGAGTVSVDLEGDRWKFQLGDDPAYADPGFDDSGWTPSSVPNDGAAFANYDGFGWYRSKFDLPAGAQGANLVASLGFIDDVDEAYLNGKRIGGSGVMPPNPSSQWFEKRLYPVPADAPVFGGENVLAVRVYDMNGGGGWYAGPVGIFSKDAVRQTVYGITGDLANAKQTRRALSVLARQKKALAAGNANAYVATLDASYFHDGRAKERRAREIRSWLAESGTLTLTDSEVEVVVGGDGTLVVDTNRTITGTRNGQPFDFEPKTQEFLRVSAKTSKETGDHSRFFRDHVDSALEGARREFVTYLPPSYFTEPNRRYPVVYLLHGINGGSREWEPRKMDAVLDDLTARGLAESIVIMPDGESLWYLDQPGGVPWRSMFLTEMVPLVDREYRTLAQRDFRALSGVSMGGFGAFSIGLSNPEMFSSLASHIGSLGYTPSGPTPITQAGAMTTEQLSRFDFYFDACEDDDYGFDNGVRQLDAILTQKGVEHTSEVYPTGRHNDECWLPHVDRSFGLHSEHFRAAGLREDYVAPKLTVSADRPVIWLANRRLRPVSITVKATDESGAVKVKLVDVRVTGAKQSDVVRRTDRKFLVRAVPGASYTFVYRATDAAGNATSRRTTVAVRR
ncbi:hypothetical protein BA895_12200 [Humibacillus sp. DSM 29435]|uniref:alpha/beta hydrolase-fold protein n=1 Tax=Humibacillus sp. DSM 29435 TaxID=1869167 RepID=UPI000872A65D|nr:alpha/beta hydrolase-fold protein [Humibacillus sp. DSM 29435]OFE18384.1 hypothetical protein BA895_12200 [Humibacillus sp. DSM 29435]